MATNVTEIYKSMIQLDADNEKLKEDAKANRLTVEVTKDIVMMSHYIEKMLYVIIISVLEIMVNSLIKT